MSIYIENNFEDRLKTLEMENTFIKKIIASAVGCLLKTVMR